MLTAWDKIIISLVAVISILIYLLFGVFFASADAERVEVFLDGKEYASYNFAQISETKVLEIKSDYGNNILEITTNASFDPERLPNLYLNELSPFLSAMKCINNGAMLNAHSTAEIIFNTLLLVFIISPFFQYPIILCF